MGNGQASPVTEGGRKKVKHSMEGHEDVRGEEEGPLLFLEQKF